MLYYISIGRVYALSVFSVLEEVGMRKIKICFLVALCAALALPLVAFNFEKDYASPIDNRMLTEWDLYTGDITGMVDSYLNDRIGFRTEAIDTYTVLNDRLFGMMIHPTYTYGKDGYVFFQMSYESPEPVFFDLFCAYLRQVQDYCEERDVPFIYCLNPSKITVYEEYLPEGYHYQDKVNTIMKEKLEEYGVNYITNEELLKEKSRTEQVYNVKYDAGHWNDLGAFYGTNHILEKVSEYFPEVKPRDISEFEVTEVKQTSLPVSHFEIDEKVPVFTDKNQANIEDITGEYSGLKMDQNYNELSCWVNHADGAETLPRVLVFQGSYYNERYQFMQSAFREYDAVHNYENFINFDYYFNVFQPDCVIMETAEYATNGAYFSYEGLESKELNPLLDVKAHESDLLSLSDMDYTAAEDGSLLTLQFAVPGNISRGWLVIGEKQFDLAFEEEVAECTIDKKYFDEGKARVYFQ